MAQIGSSSPTTASTCSAAQQANTHPLFLLPSGCCNAEASFAMNVVEIVHGLPDELKLVVLHFVVCAPKVHFLKPFKQYNGGLRKEPHGFARRRGRNGEPGVEEVSPLSGANKLAKLFMEMRAGKSFPPAAGGGTLLCLVLSVFPQSSKAWSRLREIDSDLAVKDIPLDHLTSIALNPPMFPINQVQPGVPQIKVDMANDLFCFSSNGQGPHFPGERFTAGITLYHQTLKVRYMRHDALLRVQADSHRVCTESASVFPTSTFPRTTTTVKTATETIVSSPRPSLTTGLSFA